MPHLSPHPRLRLLPSILYLLSAILFLCASARADYPLLQQLDQQTRSLYQEVQAGMVRVELPVPKWVREAAVKDDPINRWQPVVNPQVLDAYRSSALKGAPGHLKTNISPTTRPALAPHPATAPGIPGWKTTTNANGEIILESRGQGASIVLHAGESAPPPTGIGGPLRPRNIARGDFSANNFGILLDDQGYVLVPLYIERETIGDGPVRMMVADTPVNATFVGSDEKTNITILKMDKPIGRPVRMGAGRPAEGSLVMLINPASGAGRLAIWTGGERDYGVVVAMDGSVCGIVRFGQFLGGPACSLVIDQLKKVGHIQRAILGARLTEIRSDSPLRQSDLALADRPALLVEEITPNSLADRCGLKVGDYILQLGEQTVGDLTTWAALSAQPGPTHLILLRDHKQVELPINLRPTE